MDNQEIKTRVNALSKAMLAKGLREPVAKVYIESDAAEEANVILRWKDVTKTDDLYSGGEFKSFYGTIGASLSEADQFVSDMPSADETRMKQFMGALANVIELGRGNGIDVEFINPLSATMKKLSENILTDQRAA